MPFRFGVVNIEENEVKVVWESPAKLKLKYYLKIKFKIRFWQKVYFKFFIFLKDKLFWHLSISRIFFLIWISKEWIWGQTNRSDKVNFSNLICQVRAAHVRQNIFSKLLEQKQNKTKQNLFPYNIIHFCLLCN